MALDILQSWNPHVHTILRTLRSQYAPVACDYDDDPEEEREIRAVARDRIRADYHSRFYQQFKRVAELDDHMAASLPHPKGYGLETMVAQEITQVRRLRDLAPFGAVEIAFGPIFADKSTVKSYIHDFSRLTGDQIGEQGQKRHSDVVVIHERTDRAFNVCLVATRNNTVRTDAADMGREVWQRHEKALFGKKPLNVFQYVPAEESAVPGAGAPDRLTHIVEDGKKHTSTIAFDKIPPALAAKWVAMAPHLDYRDIGALRFAATPSAYAASHRAYNAFVLGE